MSDDAASASASPEFVRCRQLLLDEIATLMDRVGVKMAQLDRHLRDGADVGAQFDDPSQFWQHFYRDHANATENNPNDG